MTPTARHPDRLTRPQMKKLHVLAAQRGISHEDLRAVLGVTSLTLATSAQAARAIERLENDRPESRRRVPITTRPTTGASKRQRAYIHKLAQQCEWSETKLRGWLKHRFEIDSLDVVHIEPDAARSAVKQLQCALEKLAADRGWYFARTAAGHELDQAGRDPAAANYELQEVPL